jgi:hypothetical protein
MLKPGDVVEVRTPIEILTTLDDHASLEKMPFMPEMIQYSGQRFTVSRRVEKICDTVSGSPPYSRRLTGTVFLDDLRCDGSAHGGCQAGCRIYWKEAWLRPVDPDSAASPTDTTTGRDELEALAGEHTRTVREDGETPIEAYRCQATDALVATTPINKYDPRQWIREWRAGNVGLFHMLRVWMRSVTTAFALRAHLMDYLPERGRVGEKPVRTKGDLGLRPGDFVEVRSRKEIAPTIDDKGKNRGLSFDWEMAHHCGGRYRVQDRVERIIDERNGQMIEIPSDCLILSGVVCSGEHSRGRWMCPRQIYPYWRESWLRKVDEPAVVTDDDPGVPAVPRVPVDQEPGVPAGGS